jgi:PhnB protein
MQIQPYLFFDGRCAEAVEFYRQAIGAEVEMVMHCKDNPEPPPPGALPGYDNMVIHASLRIGDMSLMMSDDCMGHPTFQGFSLSLSVADEKEAELKFNALGAGGKVHMPLGKTLFSPCFGMVVDRFGVQWMVLVPAA